MTLSSSRETSSSIRSATPDLTPAAMGRLAALCRERLFSLVPETDVVISTNPANIRYLTGYRSILHDGMAYPQAVIARRAGSGSLEVALITGSSDAAAALEVIGQPDAIWRYGVFYVATAEGHAGYEDMPAAQGRFEDAFGAALRQMLRQGDRVRFETTDPAIVAIVHALQPKASADAAQCLNLSRRVKLAGELDLLRHATYITDQAIAKVRPLIQPGVSEYDIAAEIMQHIVRHGGVNRFTVVTSGERSSRVDAYATPRRFVPGDLVRLDIGASFNGYQSDMARTVCVGTPDALQAARYDALLAGEQAQLDAIKPGVACHTIYQAAMDVVRSGALPQYQRTHCGHSIGLNSHEYPTLAPDCDILLEAGMIFCVETPYYEIGWGGMMVEDTLIVTPTGAEILSQASRSLALETT